MKKNSLFYMLSVLMVVIACGTKQQEPSQEEEIPIASYEAKGDSMLYGLACDGCNDSVLVFLSDKGGDPISMNMLNAMRSHRVFGRPEVGDRMAVMVSPEDSTKVLVAVDMDMLRGTWVYDQLPHRKDPGRAVNVDSIRRTLDEAEVRRIDSLFASMMVPREYGYTLKRDYSVMSVGGPPRTTSLDEQTYVEYPSLKRYNEWHIFNGKIIFSSSRMGEKDSKPKVMNDTAEFVILRRDTMALRFGDTVRGFRLKPDTTTVK